MGTPLFSYRQEGLCSPPSWADALLVLGQVDPRVLGFPVGNVKHCARPLSIHGSQMNSKKVGWIPPARKDPSCRGRGVGMKALWRQGSGGTVSANRQEHHSHREWETKASKGSSIPCGRGTAVCAPNPASFAIRCMVNWFSYPLHGWVRALWPSSGKWKIRDSTYNLLSLSIKLSYTQRCSFSLMAKYNQNKQCKDSCLRTPELSGALSSLPTTEQTNEGDPERRAGATEGCIGNNGYSEFPFLSLSSTQLPFADESVLLSNYL